MGGKVRKFLSYDNVVYANASYAATIPVTQANSDISDFVTVSDSPNQIEPGRPENDALRKRHLRLKADPDRKGDVRFHIGRDNDGNTIFTYSPSLKETESGPDTHRILRAQQFLYEHEKDILELQQRAINSQDRAETLSRFGVTSPESARNL